MTRMPRVFALIDPKQFEASFLGWVQGISPSVQGVIAIDGKPLRRSNDHASLQESAAHGECVGAGKSLGAGSGGAQREKSNEITAIPLLLQQLVLAGCLVTIGAMGTQTKIAEQISVQEGDCALALKDNQSNLYEEVKATFALAEKEAFAHVKAESERHVEKGLCWLLVASDSQIRLLRTPNHISCFMCCRSKFVAKNALLRKPLIILRRQVIQPACTETDRMILVLLAKTVRTWKQGLFIVREVDAYPLVLSENASSSMLPLRNCCCTEVIIKKPQDACSLT